jgi:hypothetical protein
MKNGCIYGKCGITLLGMSRAFKKNYFFFVIHSNMEKCQPEETAKGVNEI